MIEPSWKDFEFTNVATYLGMRIGTAADDDERWRLPLAKHHERVGELAGGRMAPSITSRLYAERALPVLLYAGQLLRPPKNAERAAATATERLWHIPHRSMPHAAVRPLRDIGAPTAPHLADAIRRANASTRGRLSDTIATAATLLGTARLQFGSLASLADARPPDDVLRWRSAVLVDLLHEDNSDEHSRRRMTGSNKAKAVKDAQARAQKGRPAVVTDLHFEAATALLPCLRRWSDLRRPPQVNAAAAAECLAHLVGVAQCHIVAVVKTWIDGWPTSARRGLQVSRCPACHEKASDRLPHLVACPALRQATARALGMDAPQSLCEAMALSRSLRAATTKGASAPPEQFVLFLSCELDTYQSVAEAPDAPRSATARRRRLHASAAHAARRLKSR